MLLVCVESGEIPPLGKLKELICEATLYSIDTTYTAMYNTVLRDGSTSFYSDIRVDVLTNNPAVFLFFAEICWFLVLCRAYNHYRT